MRHRLDAKLPEQLALKLERAILAQQYQPGERLPPERSWAVTLGVSRAALREALGMLAFSVVLTLWCMKRGNWLLGFLVFGEVPTVWSLSSAALITLGCLLLIKR